MVKKEGITEYTARGRKLVLDESGTNTLRGLAHSFADIVERDGTLFIGMIHSAHVEMIQEHIPELERIFGKSVKINHLAMLEKAYQLGECRWVAKSINQP